MSEVERLADEVERYARAEIEAAFARGASWAQEQARVEGRLTMMDSPELATLRAENERLREALREAERIYYTEGKDAVWRAAHMRDVVERALLGEKP